MISVVMGVHRFDQYVENSIKCILSQSYQEIEFIIVANGEQAERVAKEFAYEHYSSQNDFDLASRVVISTQIFKSDILYYDKTNSEKEVIVRVEASQNNLIEVYS